jgi:RNA polymerase sporulation-specific sigma factor
LNSDFVEEFFVEDFADCSDEQLAVMAQQGDSKAEATLIARCLPIAGHISHSYYSTDNSVGTEDFFQIALTGVVAAIHGFKSSEKTAFRTYAATCVRNELKRFFKKISGNDAKIVGIENADNLDDSVSASAFASADEDITGIISKIRNRLAGLEWEVWIRRYYGFKTGEIARMLGISDKSAQNALNRANKKLRELFDK